jgi:hypothetical protein
VRDDYWLGTTSASAFAAPEPAHGHGLSGGGGSWGGPGGGGGKPPLPPVSAPPVPAPPSGGGGWVVGGGGVLQPPGPGPSPRAGSHVQEGGAGGGTAKEERGSLEGIGQLNEFPTAYSRHGSFLAMQVCCAVALVAARSCCSSLLLQLALVAARSCCSSLLLQLALVAAIPRYSVACHSFAVNEKISLYAYVSCLGVSGCVFVCLCVSWCVWPWANALLTRLGASGCYACIPMPSNICVVCKCEKCQPRSLSLSLSIMRSRGIAL